MAQFQAQPEGTGPLLRGAALLVAHLRKANLDSSCLAPRNMFRRRVREMEFNTPL